MQKRLEQHAEAVLAVGGYDPAIATGSTKTEIWNGSGWTEVNDLNVKREGDGCYWNLYSRFNCYWF
jgi:hypothetical protein